MEPINNTQPINNNCICVFDVDNTITCGNPIPFVNKCKEYGCRLAINTARPSKYIDDVDITSMGFKEPHYNPKDYYYNPNSYSQTPNQVGQTKTNYLDVLKNKYTIYDKKNVGCVDLKIKIDQLKNLKVHIFGHIHEMYGTEINGDLLSINAATLNDRYEVSNKPIIIEIDVDTKKS